MPRPRIAIITCYQDPDYVRAVTLRKALEGYPGAEIITVKNRRRGLLRYGEVLGRLISLRLRNNPDVYVLTFRGYEMLIPVLLVAARKPVVFDEFINASEWLAEHRLVRLGGLPERVFRGIYRQLLKRCRLILADTPEHAAFSAQLMALPAERYLALPVSTDENVYEPKWKPHSGKFTVFYYGNMLPLHGLTHVLEAAEQLAQRTDIEFLIVGGGKQTQRQVDRAREGGAHIEYRQWVPFKELPRIIYSAGLCLGGPFGDTLQAGMVTTGKTYQFMCSGAPTLIGDNAANRQLQDRKDCLKTPLGDTPALRAAIEWAADHPSELRKIAANGLKTYRDRYANDKIAAIFQKRLREII